MSTTNGQRPDGRMTLAVELAAAERLADPAAAFADAREWSRYVVVVGNDAGAVSEFVAAHDLRQDLDLAGRDKWLALSEIRQSTDTDRHVFVGAGPEDRRIADHTGWEFRHVTEAAEKAEWPLGDDEGGILGRIRAAIASFRRSLGGQ